MSASFRLPDLGEGVHEAEILAIFVEEGQKVEEGDILLEVETDKAAVEIPSPVSGVVDSIAARTGKTMSVGEILVTFRDAEKERVAGEKEEQPAADRQPEGNMPEKRAEGRTPVPAAPSTRRLARELAVDLHHVQASGPHGLVTAEDVRRSAEKKHPDGQPPESGTPDSEMAERAAEIEPLPDFSQWGEIERRPFRSIRRATAARMSASWSQIPHVNCEDIADVTELEDFRQRHKAEIEAAGGRLTMTVFAVKAVATALKTYPSFNASLDLDSQEIIIKKYFHIGIAVDTPHGLMVPVLRDVDRKSIKEIAIELQQILERARTRKIGREELVGGTFTITNAGAVGGGFFSAIINHPEVAILGLGQARRQPAVVIDSQGREKIVPRLLMPLVLCFDHRVADGADAVRFQRLIIDALEDPDELLITMI